jgi:hypothetical protein
MHGYALSVLNTLKTTHDISAEMTPRKRLIAAA